MKKNTQEETIEIHTYKLSATEFKQFINLVKFERDLQVAMHTFLEYQKIQLIQMEKIKKYAKILNNFKGSNAFKEWKKNVPKDVLDALKRYK